MIAMLDSLQRWASVALKSRCDAPVLYEDADGFELKMLELGGKLGGKSL